MTHPGNGECLPDVADILDEEDLAAYDDVVGTRGGLVVVAGPLLEPTGAGRVALLYYALRRLADFHRSSFPMATVEYAVRGTLENASRIVVDAKEGITFDGSLATLLDQGTRAILVGELGYLDALNGCLAGARQGRHLFSAISSPTVAGAFQRMLNMGADRATVGTCVSLMIGLRAIPRLCGQCRRPVNLPVPLLLEAGFSDDDVGEGFTTWTGSGYGCGHCVKGFQGVHWLSQLVPMSRSIRNALQGPNIVGDVERAIGDDGIASLHRKYLGAVRTGDLQLGSFDWCYL